MDVFVSYSSSDKPTADAAVAVLEGARIRCWYAPRDIQAGKPYGDAILDAIRDVKVVVVVVSASAIASPQVLREVERAIHYGRVIVPFRIQSIELKGSFEYFLSVPHWLDAITPPIEAHLDRLRDAVQRILKTSLTNPAVESVPTPPQAPVPASSVIEVSPDRWSKRKSGGLRNFFNDLFEDRDR